VQLGCGVQTKVLEAMAAGVPVVCTPSANEGVGATPEEEVLLAETPAQYVRQLERTLDDREATARRAAAARRLIEQRHSPSAFTDRLLEVCTTLAWDGSGAQWGAGGG
jgi:glycosyltransferase involved in cell wall biosynthesis